MNLGQQLFCIKQILKQKDYSTKFQQGHTKPSKPSKHSNPYYSQSLSASVLLAAI